MGLARPQLRYGILFGLMIVYMVAACIVACALLWNVTVTQRPTEELVQDSLIPLCVAGPESKVDPLFNCSILTSLVYDKFVANGWTKAVHRASLYGASVAVKTVNEQGKAINDCAKHHPMLVCHNQVVDKMQTEVKLLRDLQHDTIIQIKHHCSRTAGRACVAQTVIITEIGEPLTNLRLLQMTWKERLQVIRDLARLVHYAQHSPLGALRLADLRRQQFVVVKGRLKLADLDDVVIGEPQCFASADCSGFNVTLPCVDGHCVGYNERFNIQKAFREFGLYIFIPEGVPKEKKSSVDHIRAMWKENSITTEQLLSAVMTL